MTDGLLSGSKVKELQAMLFPVQPIPGNRASRDADFRYTFDALSLRFVFAIT